MRNKTTVIVVVGILIISTFLYAKTRTNESDHEGISDLADGTGKLTILYDDYVFDPRCRAEPGISILIETPEIVLLFDTGGDPEVLKGNIEVLGVNVSRIDCIVLSHEHWDHLGGLEYILSQKPGIPVYVPGEYSDHVVNRISSSGGKCIALGNATRISDSIGVTNTIYGTYDEQGLVIKTNEGLILLTGCGHAGIEVIARNVVESSGENITMIIGGFHTFSRTHACNSLDEIGVEKISPIHGGLSNDAIEYFKERYGDNYVRTGVGYILEC